MSSMHNSVIACARREYFPRARFLAIWLGDGHSERMGRRGPQAHAKRVRESQKRDKRRAKDERKAARKAAKANNGSPPDSPPAGGTQSPPGESD